MKTNSPKNLFLEKVINFDFDGFYTKKRKILFHVLVWLVYFLLLGLTYYESFDLSLKGALLSSSRIMICNIGVFYLLFYIAVPFVFKTKSIWAFIIFIIFLIELWLIINHFYYVLMYTFDIGLGEGILQNFVKKGAKTPFLQVISLQNLLTHAIEVIMALSPILFLKIIFDLSRTYANSVKINRKAEQLKYEGLVMENKFLQTQLSPHFFFNSLNNLYGLTLKKDDLAPEFILKFSEIMRYTLYETSTKMVSLRDELDFIESYFEMEKIRYPKKYGIEKEIHAEDIASLKIAPLLSFVFLENAFKYGLKSEKSLLKLVIEVKDKIVNFNIENDVSFSRLTSNHSGGVGIKNAKRRLELLYPDQHNLSIKRSEKKFTVQLTINLVRNETQN